MKRSLIRIAIMAVCGVGSFTIATPILGNLAPAVVTAPPVAAEPDPRGVRIGDLIERHDCWRGDEMALAEIPSRAIVATDGGRPHLTSQVDRALNHALGIEPDASLTVYAFCV